MRGFPSLESQMMKEILSVREISCKSADKQIKEYIFYYLKIESFASLNTDAPQE